MLDIMPDVIPTTLLKLHFVIGIWVVVILKGYLLQTHLCKISSTKGPSEDMWYILNTQIGVIIYNGTQSDLVRPPPIRSYTYKEYTPRNIINIQRERMKEGLIILEQNLQNKLVRAECVCQRANDLPFILRHYSFSLLSL